MAKKKNGQATNDKKGVPIERHALCIAKAKRRACQRAKRSLLGEAVISLSVGHWIVRADRASAVRCPW